MPAPLTNAEVIQAARLFQDVDPRDLAPLIAKSERNRFGRGELIFRQGDRCPGLYIVASGLVRIVRHGGFNKTHVLHLCKPNETFAEVAALGEMRMPADAVAADAAVCVLIPEADLLKAIETNHLFCRQLLSGMARWVRQFVGMLDDLVLQDAKGRVIRYLASLSCGSDMRVSLPATKKDIANHLNLTSETFSRLLRQLVDEGAIELTGPREIRILNLDALVQN